MYSKAVIGEPAVDVNELAPLLQAFCRVHTGDAGATVTDVEAMPGHAGFSWGFTLRHATQGPPADARLVLRLPPPGVRWVGTADVLRQARVMRALAGTGVPVPAVRWAGDDLRWFGCPYTVVERLPGDTCASSLHWASRAGSGAHRRCGRWPCR